MHALKQATKGTEGSNPFCCCSKRALSNGKVLRVLFEQCHLRRFVGKLSTSLVEGEASTIAADDSLSLG